ncbi:hypothetical protein J6590_033013 [Homalodisca vitripennis]|nr:hypothetical protein J6590_033013 [Homalodisca vitripennis]
MSSLIINEEEMMDEVGEQVLCTERVVLRVRLVSTPHCQSLFVRLTHRRRPETTRAPAGLLPAGFRLKSIKQAGLHTFAAGRHRAYK